MECNPARHCILKYKKDIKKSRDYPHCAAAPVSPALVYPNPAEGEALESEELPHSAGLVINALHTVSRKVAGALPLEACTPLMTSVGLPLTP